MRLVLYTAPAAEPVSLTEAKAHCRVSHSADDDLITDMIKTARQTVETFTGRALITQTWELRGPYFPCGEFRLPMAPLASVTSIVYVDSTGATQTLATDQYTVITSGADPSCPAGRVTPAYGLTWPTVRGHHEDVVLRFVAGYGAAGSSVPSVFKNAIKTMVEDLYEERGSYVTGTIVTALPTAAERSLTSYRAPLALVPVED